MVRRSGQEWYAGAITNWDPREIELPLSFLGTGNYSAEIYADGPNAATNAKDSVFTRETVNARTTLKLKLAPGGGCAIRLTPSR